MAGKPVAVEGDVSATAGTVVSKKAQSGTWTVGPVSLSTYANLKSGGKKVVWEATCTFSFTGANASGTAVTDSEEVTLTASTKLLNKGQDSVLVDGDSVTGSGNYGNKLEASAGGLLATA